MRKLRLILWSVALLALLFALPIKRWNPFSPPTNNIRWQTQSEDNNFGYDVYRGLAEVGPFIRINSQSILGGGTTDLPQRYEYTDTAIEDGIVYWYYVESISLTGERTRLTPVFASRSKSTSMW